MAGLDPCLAQCLLASIPFPQGVCIHLSLPLSYLHVCYSLQPKYSPSDYNPIRPPSFGMGVCTVSLQVGFVDALRLKQYTIPSTMCRSGTALSLF